MDAQERRNELRGLLDTTFTPGRQERKWILQSLGNLYLEKWFTDILYRVKSGKEATVYCCRGGPGAGSELVAAKVFRPRMFRAMRNDAHYKRGRTMIDPTTHTHLKRRSLSALQKKTAYGRRLDTAAWVLHEYRALADLFDVGADVPRPVAHAPNAILMEFVGDEVQAAPILHSVHLDEDEATILFRRLIHNVKLFLSQYRVHADLSAYNVLYWGGDIRIIDFPQAVDAIQHPEAYDLLARDVHHLCRYFQRRGVVCDPQGLAWDLWERWVA